MPSSELAQRILAENEALRKDIGSLNTKIDKLEDTGRHTRWGVYALSVALAVIVILVGWTRLNRVDDKVDQNNDAIVTVQEYNAGTCEVSNKTRADALKLWTTQNDLIDLLIPPGTPGVPKEVRSKIDSQRKLANKTYAQRDCTLAANGAQPTSEGEDPSDEPTPH